MTPHRSTLTFRIPPEIHQRIRDYAQTREISLNRALLDLVTTALSLVHLDRGPGT